MKPRWASFVLAPTAYAHSIVDASTQLENQVLDDLSSSNTIIQSNSVPIPTYPTSYSGLDFITLTSPTAIPNTDSTSTALITISVPPSTSTSLSSKLSSARSTPVAPYKNSTARYGESHTVYIRTSSSSVHEPQVATTTNFSTILPSKPTEHPIPPPTELSVTQDSCTFAPHACTITDGGTTLFVSIQHASSPVPHEPSVSSSAVFLVPSVPVKSTPALSAPSAHPTLDQPVVSCSMYCSMAAATSCVPDNSTSTVHSGQDCSTICSTANVSSGSMSHITMVPVGSVTLSTQLTSTISWTTISTTSTRTNTITVYPTTLITPVTLATQTTVYTETSGNSATTLTSAIETNVSVTSMFQSYQTDQATSASRIDQAGQTGSTDQAGQTDHIIVTTQPTSETTSGNQSAPTDHITVASQPTLETTPGNQAGQTSHITVASQPTSGTTSGSQAGQTGHITVASQPTSGTTPGDQSAPTDHITMASQPTSGTTSGSQAGQTGHITVASQPTSEMTPGNQSAPTTPTTPALSTVSRPSITPEAPIPSGTNTVSYAYVTSCWEIAIPLGSATTSQSVMEPLRSSSISCGIVVQTFTQTPSYAGGHITSSEIDSSLSFVTGSPSRPTVPISASNPSLKPDSATKDTPNTAVPSGQLSNSMSMLSPNPAETPTIRSSPSISQAQSVPTKPAMDTSDKPVVGTPARPVPSTFMESVPTTSSTLVPTPSQPQVPAVTGGAEAPPVSQSDTEPLASTTLSVYTGAAVTKSRPGDMMAVGMLLSILLSIL